MCYGEFIGLHTGTAAGIYTYIRYCAPGRFSVYIFGQTVRSFGGVSPCSHKKALDPTITYVGPTWGYQ